MEPIEFYPKHQHAQKVKEATYAALRTAALEELGLMEQALGLTHSKHGYGDQSKDLLDLTLTYQYRSGCSLRMDLEDNKGPIAPYWRLVSHEGYEIRSFLNHTMWDIWNWLHNRKERFRLKMERVPSHSVAIRLRDQVMMAFGTWCRARDEASDILWGLSTAVENHEGGVWAYLRGKLRSKFVCSRHDNLGWRFTIRKDPFVWNVESAWWDYLWNDKTPEHKFRWTRSGKDRWKNMEFTYPGNLSPLQLGKALYNTWQDIQAHETLEGICETTSETEA